MRAIRDQRGQTGAEYAGMLLLVALVVAAVAAGPARAVARHAVEQVRCIAAGDGSCVAAAPSGDGSPARGPAIGDGQPIHVLPFPGSVSAQVAGAGASGEHLGVKAVVTASERRGREVLDARGCLIVPLSVTVDARLTGSLTGGSDTAGGSLEAFVGASSTYLVNASPDQVEAMEDGGDAPNPVDPRTLAVGGGIVLTEETYAGWGMSAQYRGLVLSSGHRQGDRVAAGVTRVDEGTVRVYVGEQEFVEQATTLGLGIPGLSFGLGSTSEDIDGRLRQVDIDISTQDGWNAYQAFIASGELPRADAAGVADSADVDQELWSNRSELVAKLGPIGGSMLLDDAAGVYSEATHADGSTSTTLTSRIDDLTLLSETRTDAGGTSTTTYGLLLHDVQNHSLAEYDAYHGDRDGETDGSTNARIDYTADDLEAIQEQVYETIAWANKDESGGIFDGATAAAVADYYERLGDGEHEGSFDRGSVAYGLWLDDVARADSPDEVLSAIAQAGNGNPHEALAFLNRISSGVLNARGEDYATADTGTPGELHRLDGSECR